MIQYLKKDQISKEKWDECVFNAFNSMVYAESWYLDIVAYGWEALVEDDYSAVMPLVWNKKAGISYLYQPYFTQQLGVFSSGLLTPDRIIRFLEAIPRHFRYGEINFNSHNPLNNLALEGYASQLNHELDLINPYNHLYKNFSDNNKRNLKKAQNKDLSIQKGISPELITNLFKEGKGLRLNHITPFHYKRLNHLMHKALSLSKGVTYGVYSPLNELMAGAFLLISNDRVIFLFSGTSDKAKNSGALAYLIDHVIRMFAGTAITFDFEGSNDPNLARFYRGFGSSEVVYPRVTFNRLPKVVWSMVQIIKKLR
jgi:hypothetical protein